MKKRYTEEQIIVILREGENPGVDIRSIALHQVSTNVGSGQTAHNVACEACLGHVRVASSPEHRVPSTP